LIAEARGGTLFLDEVEAMSPRAQVVLLRFLQDQTYFPVGGRVLTTADVRIIAASNTNLEKQVERSQFRNDLLFRLRVLDVRLPPLRERTGDIRVLAQSFMERFSRTYQKPKRRLSERSLALLEARSWPGNVRELESFLLREFLMQEGNAEELVISSIPLDGAASDPPKFPNDFRSAKNHAIAEFEKSYLEQLLRCANGNMSLAARLAHKDRGALKKLVKKYGINVENLHDASEVSRSQPGVKTSQPPNHRSS
jgi:DNA-binding NtrC family response regulator